MLTRFTADLNKGQGLVTLLVAIGDSSLHWSLRLRRTRRDSHLFKQGTSSEYEKQEESAKKLDLSGRLLTSWMELIKDLKEIDGGS